MVSSLEHSSPPPEVQKLFLSEIFGIYGIPVTVF